MIQPEPVIDVETAQRILNSVVPDWEWFVSRLESEDGHFRFPPQISTYIQSLKIERYPLLYENEALAGALLARALVGDADLAQLELEVAAASPEERGEFMREWLASLEKQGDALHLPKTPAEQRHANDAFNALVPEEQAKAVQLWQRLMMGFLAIFYQHLSMMVHGEKLSALVAQAKAGDDSAFAKAVQIDKRILTVIPYFKERYERAGTQGDAAFLDEMGRRMAAPPYKGRIRHKSLWLTFAALESFGLLDTFTHKELLDVCDAVGVGGYKNRIEDVKNLSKRLAEYRRFQQRGVLSTP